MPAWTEIAVATADYGWAVVLGVLAIYLLLNGEIEFRYPRRCTRKRVR